jgi:hypothetical protein
MMIKRIDLEGLFLKKTMIYDLGDSYRLRQHVVLELFGLSVDKPKYL